MQKNRSVIQNMDNNLPLPVFQEKVPQIPFPQEVILGTDLESRRSGMVRIVTVKKIVPWE